MNSIPWWGYVILAGLSWGVYVPLIFFGGQMLTPPGIGGIGGRLASILCVGVAYFLLAVLVPIAIMASQENAAPNWRTVGLVFSGLAGVAGAVGAICVIFASKAAVDQAGREGVPPATYRVYIAPLIFSLAPAINTILSLFWHPNAKTGDWAAFHFEMPGWKLPLGILLVAAGTFLVLFSKEEAEAHKGPPKPPPAPVVEAPPAT
jgi:hypothetical protein